MNFIIDIGNTLTKLAITERSGRIIELQKHKVLTHEVIHDLKKKYPKVKSCILSSVQEKDPDLICFGKGLFYVFISLDHKTRIPLKNKYETPETLGNDRLAAAIGANYLFPHTDLLVIDCGTAITIDYVTYKREYLGGNISPGLLTRFKSLNSYTQKLPLEEIQENVPEIGRNTHEAIKAGVINGVIFEIDSYITRFKEKHPKGKVLLTGGDAFYLATKIKNEIFVAPNLLITGLNRILSYNSVRK